MDGIEQFIKYLKDKNIILGANGEAVCRDYFKKNNCKIFQIEVVEEFKFKYQPRYSLELDLRNKCKHSISEELHNNLINLYDHNFRRLGENNRKLEVEKESLEHKNFRFSSTITEQILENKKLHEKIEILNKEKDRLWENAEDIRTRAAEQEKEHAIFIDHIIWCLNMWGKLNYVGEEKSSFGSDICRLIYDPNPDDGFYRFNLNKVGK